ncbi:conserved hypothetical protein [Culex quinquefasciatus]|uniref:Uncharacterized protein n=1 Tax=Culex quinquefasciatus TaxID=7176 RepID=B0WIG6_CULQU|nr:conserved hypothetical protein [Culex quinquefasciatus]|eukprot:XP_001848500.1 conserved hypothetical protein [Culex quinquefasciatus]
MSRMAPFVERFVTVQRRIIEAGMWHRWTELAKKIYRVNRALTTTVFEFDDLLPMWQILLYGCLLSSVVFIAAGRDTSRRRNEPEAKEWWDLVKVSRSTDGVAFEMLHSVRGEKKDKPLVPAAFQKPIQEEVQKRKKPRNSIRDALLYDKDDDKPNEKLEHKLAEDCVRKHREKDAKEEREQQEELCQSGQNICIKKPTLDKDQDREENEERKRKPVTYKSLNNLFEKVVLVISGHALRKRLSLRKFALDSDDVERSDSAGEIVDEARRPKQDRVVKNISCRNATVVSSSFRFLFVSGQLDGV